MALRGPAEKVKVVLVIIFGRVEDHDLSDLRCGMVSHLHQLAEDFDGSVALGGFIEPNGREVLRADVETLAVRLLKVMDFKEKAHQ